MKFRRSAFGQHHLILAVVGVLWFNANSSNGFAVIHSSISAMTTSPSSIYNILSNKCPRRTKQNPRFINTTSNNHNYDWQQRQRFYSPSSSRKKDKTGIVNSELLSALSSSTNDDLEKGNNDQKMSIAVVGSGAVGSYYGARLWECGMYDVKFHMRGKHYEACVVSGLDVQSVDGDIAIPPDSLHAYQTTEEMGKVDWVVIALKSTSLDAIPNLIRPLLKVKTRVLAIMNGLIEDDLVNMIRTECGAKTDKGGDSESPSNELETSSLPAGVAASPQPLPCAAVYGGMALICSNRIAPGKIDHSYAGLLSGGVAASATSQSDENDREALESLWRPTKVEFVYEPSMLRGRWKKNVWNLPFNGISVAMGGITVDKIVSDPGLRRLADIVMDETISVANADLESHGAEPSAFLGDAEKKQMMDLSDNMGAYKTSTMLDLLGRKPMEVKYLFRKAVERANRLNVPVPRLETLVSQIEAFQRLYGLF